MSEHASRPPYGAATFVAGFVLTVYVITLAPTVTFWDAGELIAAGRILGIPHPPGTPLFVLLANVWGTLFPFGDFAWRTNLLTAVLSAAGAGLWFLIVWTAVGEERPRLRWGAASSSALLSAFTFTVWQNSNETEVYMVATFTIALVSWLALRWRDARGTPRATHLLIFIVYLQAVSVGNHLLALLVGPALIAFVVYELRTRPAVDVASRQREWAEGFVLAAGWGALTATGLGSVPLLVVTGAALVAAMAYAVLRRSTFFALAAAGAIVAGVSIYAVLYVRAGLAPAINEANPATLDGLLAVIRREQYPLRTPLDNPIFLSGPDNPGRSFDIIGLQLLNYIQYFDWQWARSVDWTNPVPAFVRLPITMVFATLGVYGLVELRRRDRSVFWLLFVLWLVTGLGLVAYMNFKPGFSIAWDRYGDISQHEVRERDYFFVVSFLCWGLFAGLGLLHVAKALADRFRAQPMRVLTAGVFAVAVVPLVLNFKVASRAHGPDAYLPSDFAYDLLQSVEPYGILFTNADNDTFPLWYLQEVEGIRRDVSVVNLSLANTRWFIQQLRDRAPRAFEPETAPARYARVAPTATPPRLHELSDEAIETLVPHYTPRVVDFRAGPIALQIPQGTVLTIADQIALVLVQRNWNRRPIYWALTAGEDSWRFFIDHVVQEGLVFRLEPDTTAIPRESGVLSAFGTALDVERTAWLADTVYRYADLFEVEELTLEPTAAGIAQNLAFGLLSLVGAYEARGDQEALVRTLERYLHLRPNSRLLEYLETVRSRIADSGAVGDGATVP